MSQDCVLTPVAFIHTEFPAKFGIPRQAGLAEELRGKIVFEPAFRADEALRGLEGFSHIWLIWGFSENRDRGWTPTVRPPRLGGNMRLGVFATRSPFRPNGLGLSCVRLVGMQKEDGRGTCLLVAGADLMDGTPIYDIKPYLPYADCRTEAVGGFAPEMPDRLEVLIPPALEAAIPEDRCPALTAVLAQDPRPPYQEDPERVYGMSFAGLEIRFRVEGRRLTVLAVD